MDFNAYSLKKMHQRTCVIDLKRKTFEIIPFIKNCTEWKFLYDVIVSFNNRLILAIVVVKELQW